MMTRKKTALLLTVMFIFVMLFSHVFVIAEADHDCSGEDCPVCEVIAVVSDIIKELSLIGAEIIICAAIIFGIVKYLYKENKVYFAFSLIDLKVKLSN